jgi:N6-L-threonylcarbamoyladenine synthase
MKVLGIETSCDETSAAIVDGDGNILSHIVYSQLKQHAEFGGVVPEIAARAHVEHLDDIVQLTFKQANLSIEDIDAIAATSGPGLIGGVLVGAMFAKGVAAAANKPFIAINHLEGHALTPRMTDKIDFPFLLLLVSGGHCQILHVKRLGSYEKLGETQDDAVGEAFDKVAKMMNLGYPGGPIIEQLTLVGNPKKHQLPRPLYKTPGCNFSFSGLKTAVKRLIDSHAELTDQDKADISASFQTTVADILCDRIQNALKLVISDKLVIAGGVAANQHLKKRIEECAALHGCQTFSPPLKLCTDNGAMIAWAGVERLKAGLTNNLDFAPKSRWPLDQLS